MFRALKTPNERGKKRPLIWRKIKFSYLRRRPESGYVPENLEKQKKKKMKRNLYRLRAIFIRFDRTRGTRPV